MLNDIEQVVGFILVTLVMIETGIPRRDTPAVLPVITFTPPAIQHTEVDRAIQAGFLARGATGFQRIFRCIEPHIHARHHMPCQGHIIALQQQDFADKIGVHGVVVNHLDQVLPGLVVGMGLTGKHDHHRALRVIEQPRQAIRFGKQHKGSLIGSKTPREAHHQNIRVGAVYMTHHAMNNGVTGAVALLLV